MKSELERYVDVGYECLCALAAGVCAAAIIGAFF